MLTLIYYLNRIGVECIMPLTENVGINSSHKSGTRLQNHGELFQLSAPMGM